MAYRNGPRSTGKGALLHTLCKNRWRFSLGERWLLQQVPLQFNLREILFFQVHVDCRLSQLTSLLLLSGCECCPLEWAGKVCQPCSHGLQACGTSALSLRNDWRTLHSLSINLSDSKYWDWRLEVWEEALNRWSLSCIHSWSCTWVDMSWHLLYRFLNSSVPTFLVSLDWLISCLRISLVLKTCCAADHYLNPS